MFEPAPDAPAPGELRTPPPDVEWTQRQVRSLLEVQGRATHAVVGVGEQDWLHTEADLAAIAPPLTRILNRYPATAAAAAIGDEALLIAGVGGYAMRSWLERKQELQRRAATAAAPAPRDAGPGTTAPPAATPQGPTPAPEGTDLSALPDAADLGVPITPVALEEV